jgi:hypothetical protein
MHESWEAPFASCNDFISLSAHQSRIPNALNTLN